MKNVWPMWCFLTMELREVNILFASSVFYGERSEKCLQSNGIERYIGLQKLVNYLISASLCESSGCLLLVPQVNGVPVGGMTREQVSRRLESLPQTVDLLLVERTEEYSRLFTNSPNDR